MVLFLGLHCTGDRAQRPTELVETVEREVVLVGGDSLEAALDGLVHALSVDVSQEDECLTHLLVNVESFNINVVLLDCLAILVHDNKHLLWPGHEVEVGLAQIRQDFWVDLSMHLAAVEKCLHKVGRTAHLSRPLLLHQSKLLGGDIVQIEH